MVKKKPEIDDDDTIGVDPIDYIKTRISVNRTDDEDRSKFIFRELVQNADDAKARRLIIRFQEDALYVSNDGRAFTSEDYESIKWILSGAKEYDKDSTGNFGSGFVTVYALTNTPEIHSAGISRMMNPAIRKWQDPIKGEYEFLESPYDGDTEYVGVIFRFPWRGNVEARKEYDGRVPFEDQEKWPRWNSKSRRSMYVDLQSYIHDVILCCQHMEQVTLIWAPKNKTRHEAYQVQRNFVLDGTVSSRAHTILEGVCKVSTDFRKSFLQSKWIGKPTEYRYCVRSGVVSDDTGELHMIRKSTTEGVHMEIALDDVREDEIVKRNDVFLLLPLYDVDTRFPIDKDERRKRMYLYATIPLPKKGVNKFAFSAHFFPMESRMDVVHEGIGGEWYRLIMKSVAALYVESFQSFLAQLDGLGLDNQTKQKIILNNLPGSHVHDWMREETNRAAWAHVDKIVYEEIPRWKTVLFDGKWYPLQECHVTNNELEFDVLRILGGVSIGPGADEADCGAITEHPHFKQYLGEMKELHLFDSSVFKFKWEETIKSHENKLRYSFDGGTDKFHLSFDEVEGLVKYCLGEEAARGLQAYPIIPNQEGKLCKKSHFSRIPDELRNALTPIMPRNRLVHKDFEWVHEKLDQATPTDILGFINQSYGISDKSSISQSFHEAVSSVLVNLVHREDFNLRQLAGLHFIPYRHEGRLKLGTPNITVSISHIDENYKRDWIFGSQPKPVVGLSERLKSKIEILDLVGPGITESDTEKVEGTLFLRKLQFKGGKSTNLIRHFISPRHGSLFDNDILAEFLEIDNDAELEKEKRFLQEALPLYFDDKKTEAHLDQQAMGSVPCIYDSSGAWHLANEFTLSMTPELSFYGYRTIHPDLIKWDEKTLVALGVATNPDMALICKNIEEIKDKEPLSKDDETKLIDILLDFVLHSREPGEHAALLEEWAWIPTSNGLAKPSEVVWPTRENLEVLGEDCPALIRIASGSQSLRAKGNKIPSDKAKQLIERLQCIGLGTKPSTNHMIEAVRRHRNTGSAPPPKLFDVLGNYAEEEGLITARLGYYHEGLWYDADSLIIREEDSPLSDELKFLAPVSQHKSYLRAIGVSKDVNPESVLRYLVENPDAISPRHWDLLEQFRNDSFDATYMEYCSEAIYPLAGHLVRPDRIVVLDSKDLPPIKTNGGYHIVSRGVVAQHLNVLENLSAYTEETLDKSIIPHLLDDFYDMFRNVTFKQHEREVIMRLITAACRKGIRIDGLMLPIESDGGFKLFPIEDCYLTDDYRSALFIDKIPILPTLGEEISTYLEKYAVRSLRTSIQVERGPTELGSLEYKEQTLRLRMMGEALGHSFDCSYRDEVFEWLLTVKVIREAALGITYSVQGIEAREPRQAHLVPGNGSAVMIYIAYPSTDAIYEELAEMICSHCRTLFRGKMDFSFEFPDLQLNIARMLRFHPTEWNRWAPGFKPETPNIRPFETIEVEDAAYRKGYHETREKLQSWYKGCQICGMQTPRSDSRHPEVMETVNSVVSHMGGFAEGNPGNYETGNSLYLCPRHQRLMKRGLIRVPDLKTLLAFKTDKATEKKRIEELVNYFETLKHQMQDDFEDIGCEVYESKGSMDFKWSSNNNITFKREHFLKMMKWLEKHLIKRLAEENEDWG